MKRLFAKLVLFLLAGTILHVVPTIAEVTEIKRNGMWWINDYLTMNYEGHVNQNGSVDYWQWWAGIPFRWVRGDSPGAWHVNGVALVANSVFWGLILWMIWICLLFLRRESRIRRGLCPACAYPVGASELCTECGGILPMKMR